MTGLDQTSSAAPGQRRTGAAQGLAELLGRLRVRILTERYPTLVDFGCAVALLLVTSVPRHQSLYEHPWLSVLQLGLILPMTFRRRAPFAVFGVTAVVAFVQWLTTRGMPADVVVLFALYTVAAHCSRRRTMAAYAVAELGVVLAVLRWTPDGEHSGLLATVVRVFILLSGTVTAAAVLGLNVRARRAQLAALQQRAHDLERQRDQQSALAVAEERSRIAREMHDIVTHNLSVMVALADGAVYANAHAPEKATAAMRQSAETGRRALTDMRRFLGVLRADEPDALRHPQPGIAQLAALAEQVRAAGLATDLDLDGDHSAVSAGAQLTVYRLVQESLTNTLKHTAPGARARVRVVCGPSTVTMEVCDDGRPVRRAESSVSHTGHIGHLGQGLAGMRSRAAAYGGELSAGPLPHGGWRVAATLSLDDPQELQTP
ncbi:histidine kinase [Kitasatospora sp. GP82]|uniref:sensor histidine kinase n=1 Tax=Kitasatospora sp. GP82 TaxID=3035089 RepID=UPI002473DECB|nr:histidine kinase [Kitasatospora sp. GP82]MDH6124018.1 signal transduction histidine kinase [Kitasatospora sp. GP82]